jgi:hypothetical protein
VVFRRHSKQMPEKNFASQAIIYFSFFILNIIYRTTSVASEKIRQGFWLGCTEQHGLPQAR